MGGDSTCLFHKYSKIELIHIHFIMTFTLVPRKTFTITCKVKVLDYYHSHCSNSNITRKDVCDRFGIHASMLSRWLSKEQEMRSIVGCSTTGYSPNRAQLIQPHKQHLHTHTHALCENFNFLALKNDLETLQIDRIP